MNNHRGEWQTFDIPEGCAFIECPEAWRAELSNGEVVDFDRLAIFPSGTLVRCGYHERSNTLYYSKC